MNTKSNEWKSLSITITFVMILLVSGCNFPDVYKTKVYQGNQFEQGNVSQLEIGMTKDQVVFLLGNPVVRDSFDPSKWIYLARVSLDNEAEINRKIVLQFKQDKLVNIEHESFDAPLDQLTNPDKSLSADPSKRAWWRVL